MRLVLDLLIVVAVLAGSTLSRRPVDERSARSGRLGEPGLWLAIVTALLFANQVLVNVYIIRVHGGDPSFVTRFLPSGYFDLADHDRAIGWLARHFPDPAVLAPSVLRLPAFFELPFGLLAYLTVARWFDDRLYARLTRPATIWAASIAYSTVFGLVEWDLRNPYTWSALVVRGLSCIATPLALRWMARRAGDRDRRTQSAAALLIFAASAAALGTLILTAYDSILLYNLGRVPRDTPIAAAAGALLVAARLSAKRITKPGGSTIAIEAAMVSEGLALFFIPALPIRYGIQFGTPWVSALAVTAVGAGAAVAALRQADRPRWPRIAAIAATSIAISALSLLMPTKYQEIRILTAAAITITAATALAAMADRRPSREPLLSHEPPGEAAAESHHNHTGAV